MKRELRSTRVPIDLLLSTLAEQVGHGTLYLDQMASGEDRAVQVQRNLTLEIGAVGAVWGHGFHPSKARVSGQLLVATLSASMGTLH